MAWHRGIAGLGVALALGGGAPPAHAALEDWLRGAVIAAQGFFLTDAEEARLGERTARQILAEIPALNAPAVTAYVAEVGARTVRVSDRPGLTYRFTVLDSPEINAFAAPGGYLFITTGALRFMRSEAQLAGVLGHEVAHVAKRHSIAAIRQVLIAQGLATALLAENRNQLIDVAANVAATLVLKGYGREAEYEADRLGATYAFRAGYDPRSLADFLGGLARAAGETPAWLVPVADHPRSDDRIARLTRLLSQAPFRNVEGKIQAGAYQARALAPLAAIPQRR